MNPRRAWLTADEGHMVSRPVSCRVGACSITSLGTRPGRHGRRFHRSRHGKAADAVGSRGFLLGPALRPLPAQVVAIRGERARDIGES